MVVANSLAYDDMATITGAISFIIQVPGVSALRLFSFVTKATHKQANNFQPSVIFASKAVDYTSWVPYRSDPIG
jgi:hypothetical protein